MTDKAVETPGNQRERIHADVYLQFKNAEYREALIGEIVNRRIDVENLVAELAAERAKVEQLGKQFDEARQACNASFDLIQAEQSRVRRLEDQVTVLRQAVRSAIYLIKGRENTDALDDIYELTEPKGEKTV